jgi:hypothetical protein
LNIIESATLHTTLTLPAGYVYISIYVRRYSSLYCTVHAWMRNLKREEGAMWDR